MTLPASGAISLFDIADEFGLPHSTPFPSGFYGLGGAPGAGALSFADFYGRSAFSLSATKDTASAEGYFATDQVDITSTVSTSFTFTLLSGATGGRVALGPGGGTSTYVRVTCPSAGNGGVSGVYRVAASNGDYVDIGFEANWGDGA